MICIEILGGLETILTIMKFAFVIEVFGLMAISVFALMAKILTEGF